MNKDFTLLEKKLGIEFKNKDLLIQAFCHRSYLNENPEFQLGHNERLEFLGDAVLELIVTTYLFKNYPDIPEGQLTSWRAALVKGDSLSVIAEELDFNDDEDSFTEDDNEDIELDDEENDRRWN